MTYMNVKRVISFSIFRFGLGKNDIRENALAMVLREKDYGEFVFFFDRFFIPEDFP
ncbi:MAG: hypothetical protein GF311_12575 [Candidatus Lokiarchaeota archaeon]|nr:hypothetical protein [Candidatus Lokiarchaeota archaeon]